MAHLESSSQVIPSIETDTPLALEGLVSLEVDVAARVSSTERAYLQAKKAWEDIQGIHESEVLKLDSIRREIKRLSTTTESDERRRRVLQRNHISPRRIYFHRGKKEKATE